MSGAVAPNFSMTHSAAVQHVGADGRTYWRTAHPSREALLHGSDEDEARNGLLSHFNRKRPAGEAGRFWGYYREERYVSLYMCGSVGGR
jgi:hypothetical protein